MVAAKKKHEEPKEAASAESSGPLRQSSSEASEQIVVSDTVIETTERVEVIEEVTPEPKSKTETPDEQPAADPLTDFKEKMTEEEESPISDTPQKKNFMWPILFVFIIALLLLGGIFAFKNTKTQKINVVTLSPTPTLTPAPTKTVDLSKYPIKILNGSGISGEASRQKDNLEEEGFTVSSVGNADNSDYTQTIIQAKKTVESAFLDKLKSVLEESFTVGDNEVLPDTATTAVVMIIGAKK